MSEDDERTGGFKMRTPEQKQQDATKFMNRVEKTQFNNAPKQDQRNVFAKAYDAAASAVKSLFTFGEEVQNKPEMKKTM